jgi:ribA/ribD-fused uncharacterized protein
MAAQEIIKFYEKTDPYYEFSNFYSSKKFSINVFGLEFPTSEHVFQCLKFYRFTEDAGGIDFEDPNSQYAELMRKEPLPGKVFFLANQKKSGQYPWQSKTRGSSPEQKKLVEIVREYEDKGVEIVPNWKDIKDNVMRRAVWCKFQNKDLAKILVDTGDALIVEDSPRDSYWGVGKDGNGLNRLGEILMEVRGLLNPSLMSAPPTDWSNWNISDRLLSSTSPSLGPDDDYVDNFLDVGINVFINLQEDKEKGYKEYFLSENISDEKIVKVGDHKFKSFQYKDYQNVMYLRFPIVDRSIVTNDEMASLSLTVIELLGMNKKVLVHCLGGKGERAQLLLQFWVYCMA